MTPHLRNVFAISDATWNHCKRILGAARAEHIRKLADERGYLEAHRGYLESSTTAPIPSVRYPAVTDERPHRLFEAAYMSSAFDIYGADPADTLSLSAARVVYDYAWVDGYCRAVDRLNS